MAATVWNPYPAPIFTQSGDIAAGAKAFFYSAGTSTPLATYADSALTTPNSVPVVANASGVFAPIYLPYVNYRARVLDANNNLISDIDGISNPAPASGGGGGGVVVTASQILQTGDPFWRLRSGVMDGFVRMNARTIGSAISGATERANADTEDLFLFCWNTYSDDLAPVSTGRGANAAADWAANKTIGIPTMQGILAVGLDDMGGTAAQKIQVITTASVTNLSLTCTVSSAAGLAKGMNVIIAGTAAGTIASISGTTVTLSTAYAGSTNASASFRASFFTDAQSAGSVGGAATITQTTSEMPNHNHTLTDPGHTHSLHKFLGAFPGGYNFVDDGAGSGINTNSATTGITIAATGGGLPMSNLQPSRAGTWYMKL